MITDLKLVIALVIPFILGLATLLAILQKKLNLFNLGEILALAFALGWGIHTIVMFILSLIKVPLTFINIFLSDSAIALLLFSLGFRNLKLLFPQATSLSNFFGHLPLVSDPEEFFFRASSWFLTFVISLKILLTFFSSFIKPVVDPDILWCYALAAKSIFINKTFLEALGVGDKPPFPFFSQAWPPIVLNFWNDTILTLPHPFMFICFLTIFYSVLRRYFNHWYSLFSTFLLGTIPFLVFHVGTAYSDFPQAFYYSIATFYLFLFMKEFLKDKESAFGYLTISAILLGISIWVKKSGLYCAGINLLALILFLGVQRNKINIKDWKGFAWALFLFLLISSPWLIYHQFFTLKQYASETLSTIYALPNFSTRIYEIYIALLRNIFFEDNWHLLGVIFLTTLLFYRKNSSSFPNTVLLTIIGLQFLTIFILFMFTDLHRFISDDTLLNRLMFHFVPVMLYFCLEVIGNEEKFLQRPETTKEP